MTPLKEINKINKIVIGTRGSDLARKQAHIVSSALKALDPALAIEVRIITTHGDVDQSPVPLDTIGKGWFTKEIEAELRAGTIDLAVHSLKDVTEDMPDGLMLAAYLPREDARDVLVTKRGQPLSALAAGSVIGTDSPRRQAQMLALRPDLMMKSLRGNVPARLSKLETEAYDGIILAAAGLKRLGLEHRITQYFEPNEMVPAPGQGTLALQTRTGSQNVDRSLHQLLARINDSDAARAALIERAFARASGAGCKSPVGAYAYRVGEVYRLIGMVANDDGSNIVRGELEAPYNASDTLGETLARTLRARH